MNSTKFKDGLSTSLFFFAVFAVVIYLYQPNKSSEYSSEILGTITKSTASGGYKDPTPESMRIKLDNGSEITLLGYRKIFCYVGAKVKVQKKLGSVFGNEMYKVTDV